MRQIYSDKLLFTASQTIARTNPSTAAVTGSDDDEIGLNNLQIKQLKGNRTVVDVT